MQTGRGFKVSHIGIAVDDIAGAVERYSALFGIASPHREVVEEQGVDVASFRLEDVLVELTASTRDGSPIDRFLQKRGEGIHHVAFEVEDIVSELARLREAGIRLIDEVPRDGAHGMKIAFLHPGSFNGVLVELCQNP